MNQNSPPRLDVSHHPRFSEEACQVYPVVSRRAGGLSLGINVNPDKHCSFDCIYCQVDRKCKGVDFKGSLEQVMLEIQGWLKRIGENGHTYQGHFLRDIAIAGDGEPTSISYLPQLLDQLVSLKTEKGLDQVKLVLFTNGTGLARQDLAPVWPRFFGGGGEVWFKLDAWDQASLDGINRTSTSFERLLANLKTIGKQFPLTLQSCFFQLEGQAPPVGWKEAYIGLVQSLLQEGVKLQRIQAYTLARRPASDQAKPYSDQEMTTWGQELRQALPIPVQVYFQQGAEA